MDIRLATSRDADEIWATLQPVFAAGETYAIDPAIGRADALKYWMDQPTACYVAIVDEKVVGTYYIRPNQSGGGAHVCNCGYVVAASAQGQGVAAQMCIQSQTDAAALGFRGMQFNLVLDSNAGAVRLWHRLGFVTIGMIPKAFLHPALGFVDAHVMYKAL